jgi:alkyl sulfatase BDS1-like metallo-beta-lactamase superfamily hydrolase
LLAPDDSWQPARDAKARLLQLLAETCQNPLIRNWQLTEVELLRNTSQVPRQPKVNGDTIAESPVQRLLNLLASRLNPKTSAAVTMSIGFDLPDIDQQYTFFIRRGIGELAPGLIGPPTMTVRANEQDMKRIFLAGDVPPSRREFWQRLEFEVPDSGLLTAFRKLRLLVQLGRLFLRP